MINHCPGFKHLIKQVSIQVSKTVRLPAPSTVKDAMVGKPDRTNSATTTDDGRRSNSSTTGTASHTSTHYPRKILSPVGNEGENPESATNGSRSADTNLARRCWSHRTKQNTGERRILVVRTQTSYNKHYL